MICNLFPTYCCFLNEGLFIVWEWEFAYKLVMELSAIFRLLHTNGSNICFCCEINVQTFIEKLKYLSYRHLQVKERSHSYLRNCLMDDTLCILFKELLMKQFLLHQKWTSFVPVYKTWFFCSSRKIGELLLQN